MVGKARKLRSGLHAKTRNVVVAVLVVVLVAGKL
jgi:hypothetical protein